MVQFERIINVVDAHTAGEPARVILSGLPKIPGATMLEKMKWFEENMSDVRNLLMREPRGHRDMFGAIVTPAVTDDGDVGILYTTTAGQGTMCGHATIGAVTVLVQTGIIPSHEGANVVRIDAPAGRITATATVCEGRVTQVSFQNVPSFLYKDNIEVDVPGIGKIKAAVSFGGGFYIFVKAEDLGLRVVPEQASEIIRHSMWLKNWGNRELDVVHPTNSGIKGIFGVAVTDTLTRTDTAWKSKATIIFAEGSVDRSPCGTGTSAYMALLYGRGQMSVGQVIDNSSILNTTFRGTIDDELDVGGKKGIIPSIAGSAWITGFNQLVVDPTDPLKNGFLL